MKCNNLLFKSTLKYFFFSVRILKIIIKIVYIYDIINKRNKKYEQYKTLVVEI